MHCDTFVCLEWGGPAVVSGSGCIGALVVGVRTSVVVVQLHVFMQGLHMYLKAPMPVLQPRPTQHDFATNPCLLSDRWCVPFATLTQPTRRHALIAKYLCATFSKTTGTVHGHRLALAVYPTSSSPGPLPKLSC